MGKRSKAAQARLANLSGASQKIPKATVEDVSDSEDLDYFPGSDNMAELETVSDSDDGEINHRMGPDGQTRIYFAFEEDELSRYGSEDGSDVEGSDLDEEGEADVRDDAGLLTFTNVMQNAQETAAEAERQKREGNKWPRNYARNSSRSHRRFAEKQQKLAADGRQAFISNWLTAQRSVNDAIGTSDPMLTELESVPKIVNVSHNLH